MQGLTDSESQILDKVLLSLEHLNIQNDIEDVEHVKALGASCDVYTGYWQAGIRRKKVAIKRLRIFCNDELLVAKVRFFYLDNI